MMYEGLEVAQRIVYLNICPHISSPCRVSPMDHILRTASARIRGNMPSNENPYIPPHTGNR